LLVIAAESALGSVFQNITYTAIRHDRLLVNLSGESMRTLYNRYRGFPSDSRPVIMQAP
jgi:hypothetical protein